jgi:pilus assembly protein Flp/PilA
MIARVRRDRTNADDGASAVEYGLLLAAIAAAIILIILALGSQVQNLFSDTCSSFRNQASVTATGTC